LQLAPRFVLYDDLTTNIPGALVLNHSRRPLEDDVFVDDNISLSSGQISKTSQRSKGGS